jgi:hypothetical protein
MRNTASIKDMADVKITREEHGWFAPGRSANVNGRPKGVPNKATIEVKAFIRQIVDDPVYRANFRKRAISGKLAPALESLMFFYVIGKPVDRQEVGKPQEFDFLTDDQLREMLAGMAAKLAAPELEGE